MTGDGFARLLSDFTLSAESGDGARFEVEVAGMRAGLLHAHAAARGPAMHHRVGHVGMKLEAERVT